MNSDEIKATIIKLPAMKTGEIHYSLNPRKANEIKEFYETHCK